MELCDERDYFRILVSRILTCYCALNSISIFITCRHKGNCFLWLLKKMNLAFVIGLCSDYFCYDCAAMMYPKESKFQVQILVDILNQDNQVVEMLVAVCMVILQVPSSFQNLESLYSWMNIHYRTKKKNC